MAAVVLVLVIMVVRSDDPNPFRSRFADSRSDHETKPSRGGGYTFPSGYHISPERARVYLGPEAQQEMRQFLREHDKREPTDEEVAFSLLLNERLENPKEKLNPKNYIP